MASLFMNILFSSENGQVDVLTLDEEWLEDVLA